MAKRRKHRTTVTTTVINDDTWLTVRTVYDPPLATQQVQSEDKTLVVLRYGVTDSVLLGP